MLFIYAQILLIYIQICFSESCVSSTSCKCVTNKNEVIDLTSLGKLDFPLFHDIADPGCNETIELYSYNPCFPFDSPDKETRVDPNNVPCVGAAACVKGSGGNDGKLPEEHAVGLQSTAKFNNSGLHYYITYTVPNSNKNLTVYLTCDNDTKHTLTVIKPYCQDNNTLILNLTSKCACPDGCLSVPETTSNGGLSTGSKLLIAFFTILLAYLLVGVVWNFCNGAKGMEMIPNLEFWNELPVLIMEGITFTCSCFSRNRSYGEV